MGHEALVAYEQSNGTYNCHFSYFGAFDLHLKHVITPETPFGGEPCHPDDDCELLDELLARVERTSVPSSLLHEPTSETAVERDPLLIETTLETILTEYLDYLHHEAFYVVTTEYDVLAYRPLWFGLQYNCNTVDDGPTIGNGALRPICWYEDEPLNDGFVQGEFQALKDVVGDMIDRGVLTSDDALAYMQRKLVQWAGGPEQVIIRTPE